MSSSQATKVKSLEALERLLTLPSWNTVLDVGCGLGPHSERFRAAGKKVTSIDCYKQYGPAIEGDYLTYKFAAPFDCIWLSHVLEHQVNTQLFLKKVYSDIRPGGYLAVTVPPLKPNIVGGHVTLWNAGTLLYNLIVAGFDCSQAQVKTYDYNISVITPKIAAPIDSLDLHFAGGDIEKLAPYFPQAPGACWKQSFNGAIQQINWDRPGIDYLDSDEFSWWRVAKKLFNFRTWFPKGKVESSAA